MSLIFKDWSYSNSRDRMHRQTYSFFWRGTTFGPHLAETSNGRSLSTCCNRLCLVGRLLSLQVLEFRGPASTTPVPSAVGASVALDKVCAAMASMEEPVSYTHTHCGYIHHYTSLYIIYNYIWYSSFGRQPFNFDDAFFAGGAATFSDTLITIITPPSVDCELF